MTKAGNIFYGNIVRTSGLHGSKQNGKANDEYGSEKGKQLQIRAGESGWTDSPFDLGGIYEGFWFYGDNGVVRQIVHAIYPGKKHFDKGQFITRSAWDHFHHTIKTKKGWKPTHSCTDDSCIYQSTKGEIWDTKTLPEYQDLDAVTGEIIVNTNNMDFQLYKDGTVIKLKVTQGAIIGNVTAHNLTKGTSWGGMYVDQQAGSTHHNVVCIDIEPCLYQVEFNGVYREFDNRPEDPKITELKNAISNANQRIEQLNTAIETAKALIETKQNELNTAQNIIEQLHNESIQLKTSQDELKQNLADLSQKNDELSSNMETMKISMVTKDQYIRQLETQLKLVGHKPTNTQNIAWFIQRIKPILEAWIKYIKNKFKK